MAKSSISPIGSLANAKTVFFCVSVGTTLLLSPVRCASAKSPASAIETLRSFRSWRAPFPPFFVTRTTCVSALPYWLSPRTIVTASRALVGGVAERAQEERHVQVPALERDHDRHRRIEGAEPRALEIRASVELETVFGRLEVVAGERAHAAIAIGLRVPDLLPVAVRLTPVERDGEPGRGRAPHDVQDVCRDAHRTTWARRRWAILRSSRFASSSSVCASLPSRLRSSPRISSASRPLAEIKNTCPNRSSYLRFSAASASSVAASAPSARRCSACDVASPRSPMRGCAFIAFSHSPSASRSMAASGSSPAATARAHRRDARQA